ncbi:hypothetical protein Cfor_01150, partial [Coptotermes formosanus]
RYFVSRDPRLKAYLFMALPEELLLACASRITCRMLNIRASRSTLPGGKHEQACFHMMDLMWQCECHIVDGCHHLHLSNPENVAPLINRS